MSGSVCKVGKIYAPILQVFRKTVVNSIASLKLRSVSNERHGNFTFYRDSHDFTEKPLLI